jgi:hypothetical protein
VRLAVDEDVLGMWERSPRTIGWLHLAGGELHFDQRVCGKGNLVSAGKETKIDGFGEGVSSKTGGNVTAVHGKGNYASNEAESVRGQSCAAKTVAIIVTVVPGNGKYPEKERSYKTVFVRIGLYRSFLIHRDVL